MFGYVMANMDRLSLANQAYYKACYCGLCHELGRRHGKLSRFLLSYDLVFLILCRMAAAKAKEASGESSKEPVPETWPKERCIAHPARPHYYWINEETEYAADMSILLSYHQLSDDWEDDHNVLALAERRLLKKAFQSVSERYPEISRKISEALADLSAIEKSGRLLPDEAAGCFGRVTAAVFGGPGEDEPLMQLGFALGRWIYIMDALLDRRSDLKKKRYNALAALPREQFEPVLDQLMAMCVYAYEALRIPEDEIMENILYSGVWTRWQVYQNRQDRGRKKEDERSL